MNYPLEKYRFYQNGNKIIAVSTYAKGTVRGVSICHPGDNFNIETGKMLAALRCNEKVAAKRLKRAGAKFRDAEAKFNAAKAEMEKMREYLNDSVVAYNEAAIETDTYISGLAKKN